MCGINGFNFKDKELIWKMNELTRHRGPEGSGVFANDEISVGHNLLSFADVPENSRQPVLSNDHRYVLSYNGEIYNYRFLRRELEKTGERFLTDSDTEVLFRGLVREGAGFLKKLDGMFALAFYDSEGKKLLLARDPLGIKPLYYFWDGAKLIFSSEQRAILAHGIPPRLNLEATRCFFSLGYLPGEKTLFQNIFKLCPGQLLFFDLGRKQFRKEWSNPTSYQAQESKYDSVILRQKISDSVTAHTMGLKPFGLYLSGGLDSAIVLHELSRQSKDKIRTYTTRFDTNERRFNEDADMAKRLCLDYNIEHHEFLVTERDFVDALRPSIEAIEEPRYNPSVAAYWLLARYVSKDVQVIMNGSGGDELFMGYPKYLESRRISCRLEKYPTWFVNLWYTAKMTAKGRLQLGHIMNIARPLDRWLYLSRLNMPSFGLGIFKLDELRDYFESADYPTVEHPPVDVENGVAELDRLFWLADEEFLRTDKISMHFSMEGRFPLVAKDLVAYADSISSRQKLSEEQTKHLLRQAYKGHLPEYILNKRKTGWSAPVGVWMQSKLGNFVGEVLSKGYYPETADIFHLDLIRNKYINDQAHNTKTLKNFWSIVSFQMWAKAFKVRP